MPRLEAITKNVYLTVQKTTDSYLRVARGARLGGPMSKISGAIFDCDGTLLDSMSMWYDMFDELFRSYGLEPTSEVIDKVEAMTIPDTCKYLHAELGMGGSVEELYAHVERIVTYDYEHKVSEMPGARGMLESLAGAGIPMVVASSSPSPFVRKALACHGMLDFFSDILCTADVRQGRDKDFPDVYLEALDRLGTSLAETWVFEDAPFAVRSARRVGLHVVGIHNDHDGRDEDFIRSWSDIFTHNYDDVSLEAIHTFDDAARKATPEEA